MASRKLYVLKIIKDLTKLSDRAYEVNPDEPIKNVKGIINDIKRTIKANKDLVALCAPQLGYPKRIFCIKFKGNQIMTFVNPMITHSDGQHLSRETNASIDGEYIVPRANSVIAMYQDEHGKICENKFEGMASEMFEQMCQMLDGIVISDYGLQILKGFDKLTDEEKQEIFAAYIEYLKQLGIKLDENIDANKEMHDMKQAIEFMSSVAKGESEVVPEYNGELDFTQSTKVRIEQEKERQVRQKELEYKERVARLATAILEDNKELLGSDTANRAKEEIRKEEKKSEKKVAEVKEGGYDEQAKKNRVRRDGRTRKTTRKQS